MKKQDHHLREKILHCTSLSDLENRGFIRGDSKGKTMNVDAWTLMESLRKQFRDLELAWSTYYVTSMPSLKHDHLLELRQKIADLRNVSGCLFLKLTEKEPSHTRNVYPCGER